MVSFDELKVRLNRADANWTARQTPQFLLSDEQKAKLLGVIVDEGDLAAAMAPRPEVEAADFEPEIDWRNRNNGNHVTSIKDQASCGSCVSFGAVATVESMALIELGKYLDLSEADLHFCSDHGPTCEGWWPHKAYDSIRSRGIADEACFPYPDDTPRSINPVCSACGDRNSRAVKITDSKTLRTDVERKNWLTKVGPCCAVIRVYDDFYAYDKGVYKHIVDDDPSTPDDIERGLHCVVVVGYSEAERCWICKNSWGTDWGDRGFIKIGYGEIGIDSEYPFWTASGVKLPDKAREIGIDVKESGKILFKTDFSPSVIYSAHKSLPPINQRSWFSVPESSGRLVMQGRNGFITKSQFILKFKFAHPVTALKISALGHTAGKAAFNGVNEVKLSTKDDFEDALVSQTKSIDADAFNQGGKIECSINTINENLIDPKFDGVTDIFILFSMNNFSGSDVRRKSSFESFTIEAEAKN